MLRFRESVTLIQVREEKKNVQADRQMSKRPHTRACKNTHTDTLCFPSGMKSSHAWPMWLPWGPPLWQVTGELGGGSSTMCFMGLHVFSFSYSKWKIKNIFVLWTSHYHSHNNEVLVFIFTKQQTWTLADEASSRWPCSHNIPKFMSCLLCLCFIKDVVTWHRALNRRTWYMRVKHKNEKINVVLVCKKKILHESFNLKPTSGSAYIRLAVWQIRMTCNQDLSNGLLCMKTNGENNDLLLSIGNYPMIVGLNEPEWV